MGTWATFRLMASGRISQFFMSIVKLNPVQLFDVGTGMTQWHVPRPFWWGCICIVYALPLQYSQTWKVFVFYVFFSNAVRYQEINWQSLVIDKFMPVWQCRAYGGSRVIDHLPVICETQKTWITYAFPKLLMNNHSSLAHGYMIHRVFVDKWECQKPSNSIGFPL